MTWARMRFRGDAVFVRVDERGKMLLDGDGRAEMKYRPEDARSYRPSPTNLLPDQSGGAGGDAPPPARAAGKSAASTRPARSGPQRAADPATIHVWTDGACTGNPGPMGIGVVVLAAGEPGGKGLRRELGEYLGVGTNNIAELVAIERGLAVAAELDPDHRRPVRVYSDSAYSIGVVSKGWKAKANQELVARLRKLVARFPDLDFVKVAGHAGVVENERCDELARRAIETRGAP